MMPYLRQMMQRLVSDRKKLAVMVSLTAVLMLLWGRLILKQVPRTAVAKPPVMVMADKASRISLGDGRAIPTRVEVELPTTLSRDLFSLRLVGYEPTATKPVIEVKPEKSVPKVSDEEVKASMVRQAAVGLKLQTTIRAQQPLALINGVLLHEGMNIKGFKLLRILDRQVILEMNGIEINLEM